MSNSREFGSSGEPEYLSASLSRARAMIQDLEEELADTNQGLMALTMELEQRVDARTAELRAAQEELQRTNSELLQLTLELEDRVLQRTRALQESEERYRTLSEAAQEIIFIIDKRKRLLYINSFGATLLRAMSSELLGRSVEQLFPGLDQDEAQAIDHALVSAYPLSAELSVVLPGDGQRWLDLQLIPLEIQNGESGTIMGVARDVTERRRAEREIRELNTMLEQRIAERTAELEAKNRELETFTYSVSHDLKAPLRGIDGYSRLLLEDHEERLSEEGRLFLRNIRQATNQMGELIDDLLAYSRLERRPVEARKQSMHALVQAILDERQADLDNGKITLMNEVPDVVITVDTDGLAAVLRNLLDNAIKFTRDVEAPRIEIGGQASRTDLLLWVRDNGIGFDMQYSERIFEIFQRLHHSEDYPGTGIGLAIVRKAMERMHGRAWAESKPSQGATFYLELPK